MDQQTFIIDCPFCKAKVAAVEKGSASQTYWDEEIEEPIGTKLVVGSCPICNGPLAGHAYQVDFEGYQGEEKDRWSEVVRIYPKPPKTFQSLRIPRSAKESLSEAEKSLQANANIAACAMLGRTLEAVCRDILGTNVMLAAVSRISKIRELLMIASMIGVSNYVHFVTSPHTPTKV